MPKRSRPKKSIDHGILTQEYFSDFLRWNEPIALVTDKEFRINRALRSLLPRLPLKGSASDFSREITQALGESLPLFDKATRTQEQHYGEIIFHKKNQKNIIFQLNIKRLRKGVSLWIFRDISEAIKLRKQLVHQTLKVRETEANLIREKKLQSLSTLSSGLAHEINQPLMILLGYLYQLKEQLPEPHKSSPALKEIEGSAHRIRDLIKLLKRDTGHAEEYLESAALESVLSSECESFRKNYEIPNQSLDYRVSKNARGAVAFMDRLALSQVIKNLLKNAYDAVVIANGSLGPHSISVSLEDGAQAKKSEQFDSIKELKKMWIVTIEDKGLGMDRKTLDRLAEPFFTTKEPGKGTGLGLYLVKHYLKLMDGKCLFFSQKGKGTQVKLLLPKA